jgi:hypothetical protein
VLSPCPTQRRPDRLGKKIKTESLSPDYQSHGSELNIQRQPTQSNTLGFESDNRTLLKLRLKNRKRSLEYYVDHLNR